MSKEEADNITEFIDGEDTKPTKKTYGRFNKANGSSWERECVNKLKVIFPDIKTSRACNRQRDADKVDLCFPDESKNGRLPYNFQCKTLAKHVDYTKVLKDMPIGNEVNVILHRKTKKSANGRFLVQGKYAILNAEDFYKIIEMLESLKENYQD